MQKARCRGGFLEVWQWWEALAGTAADGVDGSTRRGGWGVTKGNSNYLSMKTPAPRGAESGWISHQHPALPGGICFD